MGEAYRTMAAIRSCVQHPDEAAGIASMNPAEFARRYGVTEQTAEDVLTARVDRLRDLGVNPICIIYLSRLLGFTLPHYYDTTTGGGR